MLWHKLQGVGGLGEQPVVTDNLLLRLDAANPASYSGTGTTWSDISGNGFDGTLTNGPVWNNTYFEFDGDNDYVEMGTITTSNPLQLSSPSGGGLTIMFASWFDGTGDSFQRIVDKSDGGSAANGWTIWRNSGQTFTLAQDDLSFPSGASAPVDNTWEIWAVTHEVSTGNFVWYKNGSVDLAASATYSIPSVQTGMRLGTWNHTDARELNGRIGFFMIYDKVLSGAEITQNYNALKGNYGLT